MNKKKYKVTLVGCGAILPRHIESILSNSEFFEIHGFYDIDQNLSKHFSKKYGVINYKTFEEILADKECNLVSILTPNSYHFEQSKNIILNGKSVLVEKPVSTKSEEIMELHRLSLEQNVQAFCVLQVRLNQSVSILESVLRKKLLGNINSVSLIQRWQRPLEYFTGWRSIPSVGGGTLYEVGIHYLDVLQKVFGKPEVVGSKTYHNKHKEVDIEDTIYSIVDWGNYGGTIEVTIASEPTNLECSISVQGSNGYLKLGGKALNIVESYNFLTNGVKKEFENILKENQIDIEPNKYGSYQGSCPNHPTLYKNIIENPNQFEILESYNAIKLIEEIYEKDGIKY